MTKKEINDRIRDIELKLAYYYADLTNDEILVLNKEYIELDRQLEGK